MFYMLIQIHFYKLGQNQTFSNDTSYENVLSKKHIHDNKSGKDETEKDGNNKKKGNSYAII